jgi:hypothetical protein
MFRRNVVDVFGHGFFAPTGFDAHWGNDGSMARR